MYKTPVLWKHIWGVRHNHCALMGPASCKRVMEKTFRQFNTGELRAKYRAGCEFSSSDHVFSEGSQLRGRCDTHAAHLLFQLSVLGIVLGRWLSQQLSLRRR